MNLFKLAYKELAHKKGSTYIAILLVAIGMASVSVLGNAAAEMENRFNQNTKGIDMVVGAKGSPLQLVLSAVLHLDDPTGNIFVKDAFKLAKNPAVKSAIPLAYGDNYMGYKILGTSPEFLDFYQLNLVEGNLPKGHFQVLLGADVAEKTGLKVKDKFKSVHGSKAEGDEHEHPFYVVGILEKTFLSVDNLIITDVKSIWDLHDHDHTDHSAKGWNNDLTQENADKQITAMLVKFKGAMGLVTIPRQVNENTPMQAALPGIELNRLYKLTGSGIAVFNMMAALIILTAALSILLSLLSDIQSRYFEMALLRCFGLSPLKLAVLNLLQALILVVSGVVVGLLFSKALPYLVQPLSIDPTFGSLLIKNISLFDLKIAALLLILAIIAAIVPAVKAYRLNLIKTLKNA